MVRQVNKNRKFLTAVTIIIVVQNTVSDFWLMESSFSEITTEELPTLSHSIEVELKTMITDNQNNNYYQQQHI
jgi:hypothetical protein